MNILISNDDGIFAKGLKILVNTLKEKGHIIYVVAPEKEESGTGHGVTLHTPLRVRKIEKNGEIFGYAVNGKPSDCVKIGKLSLYLDINFDIMISGINRGENLGSDLFYSGTVSAAAEAALLGMKSIAVSLAMSNDYKNYESAARFICEYIEEIKHFDLGKDNFLNINIPDIIYEKYKGIKYTVQGDRRYVDELVERDDPRGNKYYWLGGDVQEMENSPNADFKAVREGFVSITPISLDLTSYSLIKQLEERKNHEG